MTGAPLVGQSSILDYQRRLKVVTHFVQSTCRWSMCCKAPDITMSGITSSSLLATYFFSCTIGQIPTLNNLKLFWTYNWEKTMKSRRTNWVQLKNEKLPSFNIQLHDNRRGKFSWIVGVPFKPEISEFCSIWSDLFDLIHLPKVVMRTSHLLVATTFVMNSAILICRTFNIRHIHH